MSDPQKDPKSKKDQATQATQATEQVDLKIEDKDPKAHKAETVPKVDLDYILIHKVGEFGRYQRKTFALAVLMVIFVAWAAVEYVFTTGRIRTRCLIPECESEPAEISPPWIMNAVPPGLKGSFDNCHRYGRASPALRDDSACPPSLFDHSKRLPCETYVYENTHTVVYDYGMACQEWRRSLIGTVRTLGGLTALPLTGYMSDRFGRRLTVTFNAFNTGWIGVTRYWANSYASFMISEFVEATFGSGGFSCIYILLMELLGPKYRAAAGAAMNTTFAIGQVTMGLIAWVVPNWRYLTLTLYCPMLITFFYYWLISESVRWLMSKGHFNETEALLRKVAKVNGRTISEASLIALRCTAQKQMRISLRENERRGREPWLITQVFQHKRVLVRVCVSPVWWLTATFIYYGLSLNATNMSGNKYLNYVAVSAVEIPAFWVAYFMMNKVGRKPLLTTGYWLCSGCQLFYIFINPDLYAVSLSVYLVAKFAIAMVITALYVYTAELYPTNNRHKLFAFSSMCGRVGSMLAPLTPAFGQQWFEELPFAMFAFTSLLSGILIFFTPETLGTIMPDNFEEAEKLGLKQKK